MKKTARVLLTICVLALATINSSAIAADKIDVVASFSILGDLTQQIGGERVRVHTLVGPNGDAHVYQPTPADAKTIAQARLVVVNGFGFEGWISRLVTSSGYRGKVLVASKGIKTLKRAHSEGEKVEQAEHHEHDGEVDPHAWQDLTNALKYVENIARALGEIDPEGNDTYQTNARKYQAAIKALDSEVRNELQAIPVARRKVVTSHDAFGYFARAYGVSFIAPVGINTDAEATAADIGQIIRQIRREKIPAVFMESISDPRLLERIRQESGSRIGGTLYSDSLSAADGPAATYLDMMRHNAKTLAASMQD